MTKALVIYLMAGADTPELARAAVDGGANIVELGFPFSDPLADGPVIRRAAERALAAGMRTRACLDCLARTRALAPETPLVPMTYASLLEAYGWDRFASDARTAGATSLIVADLPAGEQPELRRVQLVAPTSTDERIRLAAEQTDGWLYLVTLTGTTGARDDVSPALAGLVERARRFGDGVPLYAGFGISTPDHARAAAALADGIVVGSRAVQVAEDGPDALRNYVASLRHALDASRTATRFSQCGDRRRTVPTCRVTRRPHIRGARFAVPVSATRRSTRGSIAGARCSPIATSSSCATRIPATGRCPTVQRQRSGAWPIARC
ncbi:MAG: tryptophan synthase subunit alpha [Actinobacteria bacterium]|nr:MAG: tryptophan synthase subunit alpha [Actinomycetota bacterium]